MNETAQRGKGGARDVIADWLRTPFVWRGCTYDSADSILSALKQAGYVVVPKEDVGLGSLAMGGTTWGDDGYDEMGRYNPAADNPSASEE